MRKVIVDACCAVPCVNTLFDEPNRSDGDGIRGVDQRRGSVCHWQIHRDPHQFTTGGRHRHMEWQDCN
jgi:hypothetical protein